MNAHGSRLLPALAAVVALGVTAPAADAVTMTLKGPPTLTKTGTIEPLEWTTPEGGGTVTRLDGDNTYTGTFTWSMPPTIPAAGVKFTMKVKAESRMNSAVPPQHTNYSAMMRASGTIVGPPATFVDVSARSFSDTMPTDTKEGEVMLTPRAGSSVVTISFQDGPRYDYTYVADAGRRRRRPRRRRRRRRHPPRRRRRRWIAASRHTAAASTRSTRCA